jgi:hypothetical protein
MKAYTVHNFWVCQITNAVIAQISFDNEAFDKPMPSVEFAKNYITKSKRDWFLNSLEKFINHKKQIINNSQVSPEKQKALTVCGIAYDDFCNKSLDNIAKRFLNGKQYYEAILPHPSNSSFESSQANLNELIKFCQTEINQIN